MILFQFSYINIFCLPFIFYYVSLFTYCTSEFRPDSAEKVRHLKEQSIKNYVLKLNNVKFREYVNLNLKNYSFVVLFAAMASHRQCSVCGVVHDEFELAAKAFRSVADSASDKLFFGFVDFDQSSEVFQIMNVNSVPSVMYFPAKRKPKISSDTLDMQRYGYSAEAIAKWLTEKSGIEFRVIRPPTLFFSTASLLILFFVSSIVIYFRCENFGVLNNRTVWGSVGVAFCLIMTSGQMWNHIRGPPFLVKTPNGGLNYIHTSPHGQYIGETYIVFLLNAGITVSMIILIDNRYSDLSFRRHKVLPLFCIFIAAILFNTLLLVFKIKSSHYPYKGLF